jgi:Rieske Fe-S protein
MTGPSATGRFDRREFIAACTCALAAVAVGGCASLVIRRVTPVNGRIELALSHYPELYERESVLKILPEGSEEPIFVLTDANGKHTALSSTCTHLGCAVEIEGTRLVCPCHGSTFDRAGRVLRGPAADPLRRYDAQLSGDGVLVIDIRGRA